MLNMVEQVYITTNLMNLDFTSDPEFFYPEAQFANDVMISLAFLAFFGSLKPLNESTFGFRILILLI